MGGGSTGTGGLVDRKDAMSGDERLTKRHVYQTAHGAFCMSEEEHRLYEEREEMEGLLASKRQPSPSDGEKEGRT